MNKDENINRFKKETAFKTPDNYFENFALEIQNTIVESVKSKWYHNLFSISALKFVVPCLIVFILCISIYKINTRNTDYFSLNAEDIENYILDDNEYNIEDEYEELLAVNLNIDQPSLSEDEIIDFLIEEEFEIELITQ